MSESQRDPAEPTPDELAETARPAATQDDVHPAYRLESDDDDSPPPD